jgi:hypothetical protein
MASALIARRAKTAAMEPHGKRRAKFRGCASIPLPRDGNEAWTI